MIAKLNRQLDNQRYTMTDKKAQHLEMSALLANVDRLNQGRLEDQVRAHAAHTNGTDAARSDRWPGLASERARGAQRSPSPRELRERRIDVLEKYLERQRRGSFDNQRVELSEEQLLEMSAADLARYVESMHAMRFQVRLLHSALPAVDVRSAHKPRATRPYGSRPQDQAAPPPQDRRDAMLNTVANIVERMHSMSMDDQRFVVYVARGRPSYAAIHRIALTASASTLAADRLAQHDGGAARDEPRVASPGHHTQVDRPVPLHRNRPIVSTAISAVRGSLDSNGSVLAR